MSDAVWTDDLINQLRTLKSEGRSITEIGRRMGLSRNAIVGKSNRLGLGGTTNPIGATRTPEKSALIEELLRDGMSAARVAERTRSDLRYVRTARINLGLASQRRGWTREAATRLATLDMFDDPKFVAAPVSPVRVVPFLAPAVRRGAAGGCRYPMWGHNERTKFRPDGTAMLCDDTISRGDYCTEHAALCYSRPARAAA